MRFEVILAQTPQNMLKGIEQNGVYRGWVSNPRPPDYEYYPFVWTGTLGQAELPRHK